MKLAKSTEILSLEAYGSAHTNNPNWYDAVKLSIEAEKAITDYRRGLVVDFLLPLPGETPEDDPP